MSWQRELAREMANDEYAASAAHVSSGDADPQPEGRVIVNPISGERVVIRVSGAQTGGELLIFDLYLPPGAHVPARHVHPVQEEQFTVLAGQMRFRVGRLGRRSILAHPGETVRVPARTAHWFGNPGSQTSHARVEVRPALRMEELFETTEAIGQADRGGGTRPPRLTDLAHVVLEFQREVAVPHVPAFLVNVLLAPLAWLGRRRVRAALSESVK
jgi:quercetin dioxygenase-like cupin family protein